VIANLFYKKLRYRREHRASPVHRIRSMQ